MFLLREVLFEQPCDFAGAAGVGVGDQRLVYSDFVVL
jgi:hypothetical protein